MERVWIERACYGLVLFLATGLTSVGQSTFLPAPTGPYEVGTVIVHWVDPSRAEVVTKDPQARREMMVQFWYPAQTDDKATVAPYIPEFDLLFPYRKALNESGTELLGRGIERLKSLRTHSRLRALLSLAQPRYPVLIFSPGNSVPRSIYTTQMEDLASHGYVVAGIDHPYGVAIVAFPDGRVAIQQASAANQENQPSFEERLKVRALDMGFVLDQIERLDAHDPDGRFTGRIDLERVGAFGHSLGGLSAVVASAGDRRFKAAINLDGGTGELSDSLQRGIEQPFMLMTKGASQAITKPDDKQLASWGMSREQYDAFLARDTQRKKAIISERVKSVAYQLTLQRARHMNFSDAPMLEGDNRGIDARRALRIVCDYTLAFFNQSLKNARSSLLDGPSPDYPEVALGIYRPSAQK